MMAMQQETRWAFPSRDAEDLVWRFCQAEATCGVRSSQAAQEAMLNRRALPDKRAKTTSTGVRLALASPKGPAKLCGAVVAHGYEPDHIHVKESSSFTGLSIMAGDNDELGYEEWAHGSPQATYDEGWYEPAFLQNVDRAKTIDRVLGRIGLSCTTVLHAAFGPRRGNAEHNKDLLKTIGLDNDHLLEIVVCMAAQRSEHQRVDLAREQLSSPKCSGMVGHLLEEAREKHFDPAARAYIAAKEARR